MISNVSPEDQRKWELAHEEHQRWLLVVRQLKLIGAVTPEDSSAPPSRRDTDGTRLFHFIRRWAHSYADLREANPNVRKNEEIDK